MALKKILSTSIAMLAIPAFAQQSNAPVEVYGRINVALESIRPSTDSQGNEISNQSRLANNRSVIGFRGTEELGGGTRAIWQSESAVSVDTGAGSFAARDTRVGVQSNFGTVFAGNWTTPYTSATQGLDPFYPTTAGYMSIMGNGSAPSSDNVIDTTSFDRRQRNSVHYWTPAWNGFSIRLAHGLH
jgi:predicted porin